MDNNMESNFPQMDDPQYDNQQTDHMTYDTSQTDSPRYGGFRIKDMQTDNSQTGNTHYGNPQMGNTQYGNPQMSNTQYGNSQTGNPQYGNPQMGNPQYGNPQMGNPQYGNPQMSNPQYGNPQMGNTQYGNPQMGNMQYGNPQMGNTQYGNPQMGNTQYGNPQMSNPQYGGMQVGSPQHGNAPKKSPWVAVLCICIGVAFMLGIVVSIISKSKGKDDTSSKNTGYAVTDKTEEATDATEIMEATEDADTTDMVDATEDATDIAEATEDTDTTDVADASEDTEDEESSESANNTGNRDYDKDGYIEVLDAYFECYSNQDMAGLIAFYPEGIGEKVWEASFGMAGADSEDAYWQIMKLAYGDDFTITYELKSKTTVQKVEYALLKSSIQTAYGVKLDFDYAITVLVEETCTGERSTYTTKESLLMAVIDGKWYVISAI